jgi:hypothetical protein
MRLHVTAFSLTPCMSQQIHPGDPAYAPPLIRPPSPASSIGTAYGEDETDAAHAALSAREFDALVQARLALGRPSDAEQAALRGVLLQKPKDAESERRQYAAVMGHLRRAVAALREDERFERQLYPLAPSDGSVPPPRANEAEQASGDVDAILAGMLAAAPAPVPTPPPERWSSPPIPIAGAGALIGEGRPLPAPLPPSSPTPDAGALPVLGLGRPLSQIGRASRSPVRPPASQRVPGTFDHSRLARLGHRQLSGPVLAPPPATDTATGEDTRPRTRSRTARARGRGR